jgi:hypothetical protein
MGSHHRTQPSSPMYSQCFCDLYVISLKREMCVLVPTFLLCVFLQQLKPTCHVMQKDGSNRIYCWTERDFRVSVAKYTHYPVSNISTFPGQMICHTVTTLHERWQEDGLIRKFCNKVTNKLWLQKHSDWYFLCNTLCCILWISVCVCVCVCMHARTLLNVN